MFLEQYVRMISETLKTLKDVTDPKLLNDMDSLDTDSTDPYLMWLALGWPGSTRPSFSAGWGKFHSFKKEDGANPK